MKQNQDIELVRGDNLTVTTTVYESDGTTAKVITGASISAKFRDSSNVLKMTKTTADASEILITDATNGVFAMYFVPADTTSLDAGEYDFDIEMTLGGSVVTIARGRLLVLADETYT